MSDLQALEAETLGAVAAAFDEAALEAVRVAALGKKGSISALLATLGKMSPDERKTAGAAINVAGRKVSPVIIEQALSEHAAVAECVVFGVPSGSVDRLDSIVACVAADRPLAKDELKNFLLLKLPAWQVPREWWFVEAIGSNGTGKPTRSQWRRNFLANRAKPGVAV